MKLVQHGIWRSDILIPHFPYLYWPKANACDQHGSSEDFVLLKGQCSDQSWASFPPATRIFFMNAIFSGSQHAKKYQWSPVIQASSEGASFVLVPILASLFKPSPNNTRKTGSWLYVSASPLQLWKSSSVWVKCSITDWTMSALSSSPSLSNVMVRDLTQANLRIFAQLSHPWSESWTCPKWRMSSSLLPSKADQHCFPQVPPIKIRNDLLQYMKRQAWHFHFSFFHFLFITFHSYLLYCHLCSYVATPPPPLDWFWLLWSFGPSLLCTINTSLSDIIQILIDLSAW